MKKYIYFLSIIFLTFSACQATVTLTAIPTPTLHPQFAALQEQIVASGERFTLHADGLLYDGETPVPGVTVSPDGAMTIAVDGETVTLDPADVDFDDEKGITIKGYELDEETGAWVEAISPAEQAARDLLIEHGFDVELVDFREEDGVIVGYDTETGELAFRDGKFDIRWAVEHMDTSDLMPTEIKPLQMLELIYEVDETEELSDVLEKLDAETGEINGVSSLILLDPQRLVWGEVFKSHNMTEDKSHEQYLAYQDAEGGIHWFEVLEMDDDLFMDLLYERGRLAYEE
ncbi:MAG: hypothetical protein DYG86_19165 [Chloroflexi bacterium CFX2]|nr:hypothetical protein [Chloroflexi bacterium CFX2]